MNTKKRIFFIIPCILLLSFCFVLDLPGAFYKYVDKEGNTIFVDDPSKIPPEYRDDSKSYRQKYDHLSEKEKAEKLEKEIKELEKFRNEEIEKARSFVSRQTKVVIQGNQVFVPVVLAYDDEEVEATLLLDTGASITALHRHVAEKLFIRDLQKGWARTAGGEQISADIARLSYVKVGPYKRENLMAGIVDFQGPAVEYDGLLGMNFLRGLEYEIDFEQQRIIWKR